MNSLSYLYTEITYYSYKKEENYYNNPFYIHKIINDFMYYISDKDGKLLLIDSYHKNQNDFLDYRSLNYYKNILLSCQYTLETFYYTKDIKRWLKMVDIVQRLLCLCKATKEEVRHMIEENITLGYLNEYYKHITELNLDLDYQSREYIYKTFFNHTMMEDKKELRPLLPLEVIQFIKK